MARGEEPDVGALRESGDARTLLRLVAHGQGDVRVRAAGALATLTLCPGDVKKARKHISRALELEEAHAALRDDAPVSIAMYKHSLILLEQLKPTDAVVRSYGVWSDAYMRLLQKHRDTHRNQFKLALDAERIRHSQIEGVAKRVTSLASNACDLTSDGSVQLSFILATAGTLERLVALEGRAFLSIEGHEGDHDWTLSRAVYNHLSKLMDRCSGLKYGREQERWSKLRDNTLALMLSGELDMTDTAHHDPKALSAIAARTDLQTPPSEIVSGLFKA